jgi:hypothetical protein
MYQQSRATGKAEVHVARAVAILSLCALDRDIGWHVQMTRLLGMASGCALGAGLLPPCTTQHGNDEERIT